jgi:hypothetical protein
LRGDTGGPLGSRAITTIAGNYAQPVSVDGYLCWNCSQVADAKKGVNPATVQPGETPDQVAASANKTGTNAVSFGGLLTGTSAAPGAPGQAAAGGAGALLSLAI